MIDIITGIKYQSLKNIYNIEIIQRVIENCNKKNVYESHFSLENPKKISYDLPKFFNY